MAKTLITVPVEIRQVIFKQLFASTIVYIGFDDSDNETGSTDGTSSTDESGSLDDTNSTKEPSSANTSILLTCRQISIEAKSVLASNISIHIWSTKAMISFLSTLRPEVIQSIRYIRLLQSFPLPLYTHVHRNSFTTFHVGEAFCMFPGLQLDLLEVEDCYHAAGCYDAGGILSSLGTYMAIDSLIQINGWKELHFITPTTQFMSEGVQYLCERSAQPEKWNGVVLDRDGTDSAACVKMFIAKEPDVAGLSENPETRIDYNATPGFLFDRWGDEFVDVVDVQRYLENREVLLVAKRGVGASYVQNGKQLHKDIKSLLDRMNWGDILADNRYLDPEDNPENFL